MDYLKKYFEVKIRYWYIYLPTVFLMAVGLFISLMAGKYLTVWTKNIVLIKVIGSIVFGMISSILTLKTNYVFSKEICSKCRRTKFLIVMGCSQVISVLFFIVIGFCIFFC